MSGKYKGHSARCKGSEDMFEDLASLVTNVGFPIGVTIYLLVRFESRLGELTKSISDLTVVVQTLLNRKD